MAKEYQNSPSNHYYNQQKSHTPSDTVRFKPSKNNSMRLSANVRKSVQVEMLDNVDHTAARKKLQSQHNLRSPRISSDQMYKDKYITNADKISYNQAQIKANNVKLSYTSKKIDNFLEYGENRLQKIIMNSQ